MGVGDAILKKWDYTKAVATKIRGFPEEIVIVDRKIRGTRTKLSRRMV
jgi:hypothetical protein